jgi:hypothetical protein
LLFTILVLVLIVLPNSPTLIIARITQKSIRMPNVPRVSVRQSGITFQAIAIQHYYPSSEVGRGYACPSQVAICRDTISHFQGDETTMSPLGWNTVSSELGELDTNLLVAWLILAIHLLGTWITTSPSWPEANPRYDRVG